MMMESVKEGKKKRYYKGSPYESTYAGKIIKSKFAEYGMAPFSRQPHDIWEGQWIDLPWSIGQLREKGMHLAPIIAQCNRWGVTEYGLQSLSWMRAQEISWQHLDSWTLEYLKHQQWYDHTWNELREALRIARYIRPKVLAFFRPSPKPESHPQIAKLPKKRCRLARPGWPTLRWQILERDRHTCQSCGRCAPDVRLEVDHKHPRSKGGSNDPDNLWTLCFACNRGKGARTST